ncbi:MAG TPA: dephospho-CoA kinase [Acidimicrobiales bacterium]|nr:dephospho-CoA kinase [Acidimicrobiales bacterium]
MFVIGLTGGIGTGKSAVASQLVERGAVLIDADAIAAAVRAPGGLAYGPLVERFGDGILAPDGTIDPPALARVAFRDEASTADLNRITHPAIGEEMRRQLAAAAGVDGVVVMDIPLLRPAHREGLQLGGVVVVDCPPELALERLVTLRHMDREDAAARMAAQLTREARLEGADFVVDNSSDREHLAAEVARLWRWLEERRAGA